MNTGRKGRQNAHHQHECKKGRALVNIRYRQRLTFTNRKRLLTFIRRSSIRWCVNVHFQAVFGTGAPKVAFSRAPLDTDAWILCCVNDFALRAALFEHLGVQGARCSKTKRTERRSGVWDAKVCNTEGSGKVSLVERVASVDDVRRGV
jgi:ribosomal protein L32